MRRRVAARTRLSQSPKSEACITGISGQREAGSVNIFPNTDRRQIQSQESAWRDQVDCELSATQLGARPDSSMNSSQPTERIPSTVNLR